MHSPIGLTVSVPLFFNRDETIDFHSLDRYLEHLCRNQHIFAVYSMAYNTRYRMLDHQEMLAVNQFICSRVKEYGHRIFVGHPYSFTKKQLNSYLEEIAKSEPDGISMLYPERYFGQSEPIINFLKTPMKFNLKPILHEMCLVSGLNGNLIHWPDNLLRATFDEVNLFAVKEDSKDNNIALKVLKFSKKNGCTCILAGGGKTRARSFLKYGVNTWLNGSTVMLPSLIDKAYLGYFNGDVTFIEQYTRYIEQPFFEHCVSKYGWHLACKAGLSFFGHGQIFERFPHATVAKDSYQDMSEIFTNIKNKIAALELL